MHLFLKNPSFSQCAKCGKPVKSHHACPFCGHYRGKEAVNVFSRLDRKQRRDREAEIAARTAAEKTKLPKRRVRFRIGICCLSF